MATTHSTDTQLQDWAMAHGPDKNQKKYKKDAYWNQIIFVRDVLSRVLAKITMANTEEDQSVLAKVTVISEHTSKSVCLPVFQIDLADGTQFTMRYNFYDWKVSVSSPRDVTADFMGLFDPEAQISKVYCEGFPKELVFGSYAENKRQFTIELPSLNYHIFVFFWIFAHQVLGKQD